jgi:apolipoprotein N-acyltransferase
MTLCVRKLSLFSPRVSPWSPHGRIRLVLVLCSVLLVFFSLPSCSIPWIAFVALVPLALALRGLGPLSGLCWGWLFGSLGWLMATWWVYHGWKEWSGLPWYGAVLGTVLFALFQGLPYALTGWVAGWMEQRGTPPGGLVFASLLTLFIHFRPAVCPGSLAIGLYRWPLAIQTAEIGGVDLVVFILVLVNWLLAGMIPRLGCKRRMLVRTVCVSSILVLVFGFGIWRMEWFEGLAQEGGDKDFLTIATVQPNIPVRPDAGAKPMVIDELVARSLVRTTQEGLLGSDHVDLILWPEIPRPLACDCESFRAMGIPALAGSVGAPVLVSCVEYEYEKKPLLPEVHAHGHGEERTRVISRRINRMFNSLWLVNSRGCESGYQKMELVPFGEQTPFAGTFPWLRNMVGRELEYSAGEKLRLVHLAGNKKVQPLVCFESGFGSLVRQGVTLGAMALVNVSDDAWFVDPEAAEFHLGMALFRAVEVRRPLIRCTNTGFGAHITASGMIVPGTMTPAYERIVRQATLYCPQTMTLYARYGSLWLIGPGIYVLVLILRTARSAGRSRCKSFIV